MVNCKAWPCHPAAVDHVTVRTLCARSHRGILTFAGISVSCALGHGGTTSRKCEGDGATPRGVWPLRKLYYRPDRLARPMTGLPCEPISTRLGWCDDPFSACYNKPVTLPSPVGCEPMHRVDGLYDLCVVIGYNDAPVRRHAGSAIFLHIAGPDLAATQGCVALAAAHMRRLVPHLSTRSRLIIL